MDNPVAANALFWTGTIGAALWALSYIPREMAHYHIKSANKKIAEATKGCRL